MGRPKSLFGFLCNVSQTQVISKRANSLEKILMLQKIEGRRKRGQQRMRWLDGIINEFEQTPGVVDGKGGILQSMGSQRVRHN